MNNHDEAVELLPCPFCGEQDDACDVPVLLYEDGFVPEESHDWYVRCLHCFVETDREDTQACAITAWNTRAPVSTHTAGEDLVERVAQMVDGTGFQSATHPDRRARNANLREKARHKARAILAEIGRKT